MAWRDVQDWVWDHARRVPVWVWTAIAGAILGAWCGSR